jgi:hypothetical protein
MPATARLAERAAAAGVVGAVLLNEPLVALADGMVAGVPGVYLYIFLVWGVVIALIWAVMHGERLGGG